MASKAEPNRGTTERGFPVFDKFVDSRGSTIRVQLSSAAQIGLGEDAPQGPWVWVFCQREGQDDSPHLDVAQARRLRDALAAFIRENRR